MLIDAARAGKRYGVDALPPVPVQLNRTFRSRLHTLGKAHANSCSALRSYAAWFGILYAMGL